MKKLLILLLLLALTACKGTEEEPEPITCTENQELVDGECQDIVVEEKEVRLDETYNVLYSETEIVILGDTISSSTDSFYGENIIKQEVSLDGGLSIQTSYLTLENEKYFMYQEILQTDGLFNKMEIPLDSLDGIANSLSFFEEDTFEELAVGEYSGVLTISDVLGGDDDIVVSLLTSLNIPITTELLEKPAFVTVYTNEDLVVEGYEIDISVFMQEVLFEAYKRVGFTMEDFADTSVIMDFEYATEDMSLEVPENFVVDDNDAYALINPQVEDGVTLYGSFEYLGDIDIYTFSVGQETEYYFSISTNRDVAVLIQKIGDSEISEIDQLYSIISINSRVITLEEGDYRILFTNQAEEMDGNIDYEMEIMPFFFVDDFDSSIIYDENNDIERDLFLPVVISNDYVGDIDTVYFANNLANVIIVAPQEVQIIDTNLATIVWSLNIDGDNYYFISADTITEPSWSLSFLNLIPSGTYNIIEVNDAYRDVSDGESLGDITVDEETYIQPIGTNTYELIITEAGEYVFEMDKAESELMIEYQVWSSNEPVGSLLTMTENTLYLEPGVYQVQPFTNFEGTGIFSLLVTLND